MKLTEFGREIWPASFGDYRGGRFVDSLWTTLESHRRVVLLMARKHGKSNTLYASLAHHILTATQNNQVLYLSFTPAMAIYHLRRAKELMFNNPAFDGIKDLAPRADQRMQMQNKAGYTTNVLASGIHSSIRGVHCEDLILLDDIFSDVETSLINQKAIHKVNEALTRRILPMARPKTRILAAATPMTESDWWFTDAATSFKMIRRPALDLKGRVAFPAMWSKQELEDMRETMGQRSWRAEFMLEPYWLADSFLDPEDVESAMQWPPKDLPEEFESIVGSMDLGRQKHPSHISILGRIGDHYYQLEDMWLERMPYTRQLEIVAGLIERYQPIVFDIEDTRGALIALDDAGQLPPSVRLKKVSSSLKHSMATTLDRILTQKRLWLQPSERSRLALLAVQADLTAPETHQGHSDNFWSLGLGLVLSRPTPRIAWV